MSRVKRFTFGPRGDLLSAFGPKRRLSNGDTCGVVRTVAGRHELDLSHLDPPPRISYANELRTADSAEPAVQTSWPHIPEPPAPQKNSVHEQYRTLGVFEHRLRATSEQRLMHG